MLSVPSSTCDLHMRCWQGGDICQAIAGAASVVQIRTVVFPPGADELLSVRSCCLADVLSAPLFRLLGWTLRPSALVFCCHQFSRTRGWVAFAEEAVRCPPPFFLHSVLLVLALTWWPQAA